MTLSPTAAAAFDAVEAGGVSETNRPPAGHVGELTVTEAKTSNKDGNEYALIEFVDGSYKWSQFAWITGPKRSEGGIKAFKFTVRQLTGQEPTGATLAALLGQAAGKRFGYEQVASSKVDPATGQPYTNTKLLGAATPVPAVSAAPAQAPTPIGGAQFGDDVPWDQPAAPAPPQSAITGG